MSESLPDLRTVVMWDHDDLKYEWGTAPRGIIRYDDILSFETTAKDPIKAIRKYLNNRDIANIQFTSGTTSRPSTCFCQTLDLKWR